jgi:nucleotide-binding universal stress UspA family protein
MTLSLGIGDFRAARRRAAIEGILARLRGTSTELLSFEEVKDKLGGVGQRPRGLQDIPLDAIVGSVGRYNDFTRSFLPLSDSDEQRWAAVRAGVESLAGLPPIEVYKLGEAYFVQDGHHRVSVARRLGADNIQGFVTEIPVQVPLSAEATPEEVISKSELAEVLERTRLRQIRPEAQIEITCADCARRLEEHIHVHRYFMGLEQQREIPWEEAVAHWYDHVYRPIAEGIRTRGVLEEFPGRTEADLYLWVLEHRDALQQRVGWGIDIREAESDLTATEGRSRLGRLGRLLRGAAEAVVGPRAEVGAWRREVVERRGDNRLFPRVLVAVGGDAPIWPAIEWALEIARREGGALRGLHVMPGGASQEAESVTHEFERRLRETGVVGEMAWEAGVPSDSIVQRSRWADLVVVTLRHPPGPGFWARLRSGFSDLVRRSRRPILAVPEVPVRLGTVLLAFDGDAKSMEALYVAAYLACVWDQRLHVLTVRQPGRRRAPDPEVARRYLQDNGTQAEFHERQGKTAAAILAQAEELAADMIIMGSYGHGPLLEALRGSTVDEVLRGARVPVLICV